MSVGRPERGKRSEMGPWHRAAAGILVEMGAAALYLLVLLGLCAVVSRL